MGVGVNFAKNGRAKGAIADCGVALLLLTCFGECVSISGVVICT